MRTTYIPLLGLYHLLYYNIVPQLGPVVHSKHIFQFRTAAVTVWVPWEQEKAGVAV